MQGARAGLSRAAALVAVAGVCLVAAPAAAPAAQDPPRDLPAAAWVLVDARDGEVLAAHRAREQRAIASTTKLMTAYVARERLRLGEEVVAPAYSALAAESLMGLQEGERIEVRDLLLGLLLASGNDAANALAVAARRTEPRFVDEMNAAADRLGLDDTSYANPIGLDEPGNYSTAADLAELTKVLRDDPLFRRIFDTASATTESGARPRTFANRNALVGSVGWINGVKTGYTLDAGNVLVGSGRREGVQLISAVLGAPTESERDAATLTLLDYGFSLYERRTPVRRGEAEARVAIADRDLDVPLRAADEIRVTVRDGQRVSVRVRAPEEVDGPIARGDRLGEAVVAVDGQAVGRTPLVAARSASAASLVERYDALVPGPRLIAWLLAIAALSALLIGAIAIRDRRR